MYGKTIAENRAARHEYFIDETVETGIVLDGGEVKSVRCGSVNLKDSFCLVAGNAVFLKNAHIAVYDKAGAFNARDAKRDRKLLLHKKEILRLRQRVEQKGCTLVPLRLYYKDALIKVELGVCRGKHTYDKKKTLMEKDVRRKAEREIKEYSR